MKTFPALVITILLISLGPTPASADAQLEGDLEQMMEWFTGRFDNYWQVRLEEGAKEPVEHPHGRIHSIFAPIEMPSLGEHVFYVQQYSDGDPTKIYRQRLYRFGLHEAEQAVELVIYAPPDAKAVVDAHLDPTKLAGLGPDNLKSYPGCEVYWQRQGRGTEDDHFIGFTKENACQVTSSRSGKTLIISDDLRLDAGQIWIQDRAVDTEGNWIYGNKAGIPHKLQKVRFFECYAAAPKGEKPDGTTDWNLWRPIEIHDQGGSYPLVPPEAAEAQYTIELFQAVYEGENTVPVLELAVREKGKEKSIAYAWADPKSERIGINLRSIQTGCKLQAN
ncbi:MAG: chromophore lyase CpcT/CpeT [Acidobacteriota bacterium]